MKHSFSHVFLSLTIILMCMAVISSPTTAANSSGLPDVASGAVVSYISYEAQDSYEVIKTVNAGGEVKANSTACAGDVVKVYIDCDTGYQISSIFVISSSGEQLLISLESGGYSFVMPHDCVTIDVNFQRKWSLT